MKKFITLALCSFALLSHASAQIKRGEKMLGGSISFVKTNVKNDFPTLPNDDKTESSALWFAPQFGIGLGNNWIVGIRPGVSLQNQKQDGGFSSPESKSYSIIPDVFVRKYTTIGERFGLFGQADVFYGFGKNKYRQANQPWVENKQTTYGINLRPGAYFKASKRFIIETTIGNIGYTHTSAKPDDGSTGTKTTINNLELSVTSGLSLGFQIVL